jgi:uncharacterized protein (TIGR03067 family)
MDRFTGLLFTFEEPVMRLQIVRDAILLIACAFCLPPLLAQDTKSKEGAPDYLKRLQGGWKLVSAESEGSKTPAIGRWVFKDSEVRGGYTEAELKPIGTVKLDPSQTPKQLDFIGGEGPETGRVMRGIFKIEQDRLIICLGPKGSTNRPSAFEAPSDSGWVVLTLERTKK